ncbi:MAG TPA: alpha-L-arabinofuranosidase C-terminal domain-containing protein [Candidatus Sulfotelmatobacter sp.]|nr:alpha-L-arabinofuranosidase C-terminal domain-containing protein [Candidatus Sulfotelmatobacter sp.]
MTFKLAQVEFITPYRKLQLKTTGLLTPSAFLIRSSDTSRLKPQRTFQCARLLAAVLTLIVVSIEAPLALSQRVTLLVDVSKTGPKIDRNIFGQFAEHLGHGIYEGIWVGPDSKIPNTRGIRNDVVTALKALRVPNVRWPGGCFADEYHWRNGIGPQRVVTLNPNWGGVIEPNTFGTAEFMDFLEQIGADAYVSVNVGSGTPREAAEWLEYLTAAQPTSLAKERAANGHPGPYKVGYLGIGNESWDCGGNMTPDYYLSQMKIYSRFVRNYNPAQQDKQQMLRIAVGPGGGEPRWTEWTETVMKAYQHHTWSWDINGLSMHNYTVVKWPPAFTSTGFGETEYAQILKATLEMDDLIQKHSAIMDKYDPEKKVALVVDEWGGWYAPLPGSNPGFLVQQNSLRDGILTALNLNIFAHHADRVRMANIAQMINVLQAMIMTDKEKMVPTPTYYVFKMYVPFQDSTFVPVTFDAGAYSQDEIKLPRVDAIAAKDKDGKLWVEVTNIDPNEPAEVELNVAGISAKSASGETLTAPKVDSVDTFDAPNTVAPKPVTAKAEGGKLVLKLEPKSVTVVSVEQ